ncbi:MAG: hypothetical protein H0V17_18230 [Deltaproteobacteria bacterium]|nr:hypothetical protein [Deltaproteobacteria bacterium]
MTKSKKISKHVALLSNNQLGSVGGGFNQAETLAFNQAETLAYNTLSKK